MRAVVLALLSLTLAMAPAIAETATDLRAIGVLTPGTKGGCTATLIAPDLVLTAAHCLLARVDGVRNPPTEYTFYPSTASGVLGEGIAGQDYMVHPVYLLPGLDRWLKLPRDLGLLRLQHPVPSETAIPIGIEVAPDQGTVRLISIRGRRAVSRDSECPILQGGKVLTLGCEVRGGESGAPVLAEHNGVVALVGVLSSRSTFDGQPIALAVPLGENFTGLMTAFRDSVENN